MVGNQALTLQVRGEKRPFPGTVLQMPEFWGVRIGPGMDTPPGTEAETSCEDKDADFACLAANAHAGLKAGAHTGALGRAAQIAGFGPAAVGGGRLHPGMRTSPQPDRGPRAARRSSEGRPGTPSPTAPPRPESLLTCGSLPDETATQRTELQRPITA